MTDFKCMLAANCRIEDIGKLRYPLLVSKKIDGVRICVREGKALSRTGKLLPNLHLQEYVRNNYTSDIDGEVYIEGAPYNEIQSAVMGVEGEYDFKIHNIDTYLHRMYTPEQLEAFYKEAIKDGYEGVVIRDTLLTYKLGRSTLKEQYMVKIVPYPRMEAEYIDVVEAISKDGDRKFEAGKVVVRLPNGIVQECGFGKGLDKEFKRWMWDNHWDLAEDRGGDKVVIEYREQYPTGKLRLPKFIGFRNDLDIGE